MSQAKGKVLIPSLVLAVGVGWLMNSLKIIPDVNWVWSLGLGATGALWLVCEGINRATIVIGPFLLVTSVLSITRQQGYLDFDVEVPLLVITMGALLLLSKLLNLPTGLDGDRTGTGSDQGGRDDSAE